MAFAVLAVVSYNLSMTSTKEDRFPLPAMKDWRNYLTQLIPVTIFIITASVVSCWAVTRRRKPYSAALVLALHLLAVIVASVYCFMIYSLIQGIEISPEEMKNRTESIFVERAALDGGTTRWVPVWLIEVQSKSPTCCGIVSFQDWGRFWSKFPGEVPESCCRDPKKCISVIDQIDWPGMPSDFIKNDEGCANLIVETAGSRICEVVNFLLVLIAMLITSLAVFIFQYTGEFCFPSENDAGDPKRNITNLTIGETWARMGFKKTKTDSEPGGAANNDATTPNQNVMSTQPGSYADIYLSSLNSNVSSLSNSTTPVSNPDNGTLFTYVPFTNNNNKSKANPNK
jgi:hypothetical protein